jgi:hypothetical protein
MLIYLMLLETKVYCEILIFQEQEFNPGKKYKNVLGQIDTFFSKYFLAKPLYSQTFVSFPYPTNR